MQRIYSSISACWNCLSEIYPLLTTRVHLLTWFCDAGLGTCAREEAITLDQERFDIDFVARLCTKARQRAEAVGISAVISVLPRWIALCQ
jgi:hypothetical protein